MINCDCLLQKRWFVLGHSSEHNYTILLGTFSNYEQAKSKLVPLSHLLEMLEGKKAYQDILDFYPESLHVSYTNTNSDTEAPGLLNGLYSIFEDKLLQMDLELRMKDCGFLSSF